MGKRKHSDDPPPLLSMQPFEAATGGDGAAGTGPPCAVYFPSGFRPGVDAECRWQVYRHNGDPHRVIVVASTNTVDFVGDSAGEECAGPASCRWERMQHSS